MFNINPYLKYTCKCINTEENVNEKKLKKKKTWKAMPILLTVVISVEYN
jgi:hypothetical protein